MSCGCKGAQTQVTEVARPQGEAPAMIAKTPCQEAAEKRAAETAGKHVFGVGMNFHITKHPCADCAADGAKPVMLNVPINLQAASTDELAKKLKMAVEAVTVLKTHFEALPAE